MLKPTLTELKRITGQGVALVDFDVPWSASCRIQEQIINSLARRFCGSASVISVDVNEVPIIARDFDIHNVPTLILFKKGKEINRFIGLQPDEALSNAIEKALKQ